MHFIQISFYLYNVFIVQYVYMKGSRFDFDISEDTEEFHSSTTES